MLHPLSLIAGTEMFVALAFSNVAENGAAQVSFNAKLAKARPSGIAFLRSQFATMEARQSYVKRHD
jgi:hypothetical protein